MTTPNQPSQPDPPGDITGNGSWSEVQHMSEDDWKDQINAEWDTKFNPIQDGTNFLITIMLKLLASLLNMVPIVGSTLAQVVTNIANGLNQTNNTAVTAGTAASNAQTTADATGLVVQTVRTQVVQLQDGIPIRPAWESMNPTENVTFPRSDLDQVVRRIAASGGSGGAEDRTGPANTSSTQHTHSLGVLKDSAYAPAVSSVEAGYVMSTYSGGRSTVSFIADAVSGPCELYVVLARMLPSGNVVIEWVSPNQTPLMAVGRSEHTVTLPIEVQFEPGEWMVAAIHQRGAGNPRPLMGKLMSDIPRPGALHPPQQKMHITSAAPLTAGATIAKASQVFTSRNLPWIGIGQVQYTGDAPPRTLYDDFDRPDNNDVGPNWVKVTDRKPRILENTFAFRGNDDGTAHAIYGMPLAYDSLRVEAEIGHTTNSRGSAILFRCDASVSVGMALSVVDNSASLHRKSGGVWTQVASISISNIAGDVWRVEASQNGAAQWVYTAFCQEDAVGEFVPRLQWVDTAGVVPVGAGYRYCGLGVSRASFANSNSWRWFRAVDTVIQA